MIAPYVNPSQVTLNSFMIIFNCLVANTTRKFYTLLALGLLVSIIPMIRPIGKDILMDSSRMKKEEKEERRVKEERVEQIRVQESEDRMKKEERGGI